MEKDETLSFFQQVRDEKKTENFDMCYGCMETFDERYTVCPHCGYVVGTKPEEPVFMLPGTVLRDRYVLGKALGHGSFGVTYIAWDKVLMQKVAIKEFLPNEFSTRMPGKTMITILGGNKSEQFRYGMRKLIDEARRLAKFKNEPGIVKIFDSFEDNNSAYIIMELLEGETVAEYIQHKGIIPEDEVVALLMPVLASLEKVHKEGIIHRDISPDNIFINKKGEVKLIDFGAARYATTSHTRTITTIIKPGYSPEEQYRSSSDQGPHTDVYAMGATMYKMMTGKTPPDGLERRTQYETKGKDILIPPSKLNNQITRVREVALLNALNIEIKDRTPDIESFTKELNADKPARRINGKIKKLATYRWPLWAKISIPTVLTAIAAFVVLLLTGVIKFNAHSNEEIYIPEGYVVSPNIEGSMNDEAQKLVEDNSLQYKVTGQIYSDYCDANVVIYQNPIAGAYVLEQDIVEVKICSGNGEIIHDGDKVVVPVLKAMNVEEAKELLENAKLQYEIIEKNDDKMEKNLVISSNPEAGTSVEENSTVTVYVSLGSKSFDMINVVGMDYKTATKKLNELGLKVTYVYETDNSVPENQVTKQDIAKGEQVVKGDEIVLTVAVSEADETVEVPNVVGKTEADAKTELNKLEFKVTVSSEYSSDVEAGKVIRTSPKSGTKQKRGSDIIIYVSKGVETFTVTLNPNGGTLSAADVINVKKGDTLSGLPTPVRSDYEFLGWFTQQSGGIRVDNGITVSSGLVLYAQWKSNKKEEATAQSISASVKQGTRFIGDTLNKSDLNVEVRMSDGTIINNPSDFTTSSLKLTSKSNEITVTYKGLSAKVTVSAEEKPAVTYTIKYDSNGGTGAPENQTKIEKKDAVITSAVPTRTGYSFAGWSTSKTGSVEYASGAKYSADKNITLYAVWTVKKYIVTFDANGGSTDVSSIKVEYKATYGNLPEATRRGYSFEGWFTAKSDGTQVTATTQMNNEDVTVYAHWKAKTYTITFDVNGGNNAIEPMKVKYGSKYGTLPTPTRDYYTFEGWYTEAGAAVNSSTVMKSNVKLYAHWTENPVSNWVSSSKVPAGAQIVEEKWRYNYTERKNSSETTSDTYSEAGWDVVGSTNRWVQSGSGTVYTASVPSGVKKDYTIKNLGITANSFGSGVSDYENTTNKRVVSSHSGYVYYHWAINAQYYNNMERPVSTYKTTASNRYVYGYFFSFADDTNYPSAGNGYCLNQNITSYNCSAKHSWFQSVYSGTNDGLYTPRFFRYNYTRQDYTDYVKYFTYSLERTTKGLESSKEVYEGKGISNVVKYVKYRAK